MTRLTVWEYMPWWLANVPIYGFWLWFSLRARHLLFFANVNPAIPLGGAMGESKSDILRLLPLEVVPKWILVQPAQTFESIQSALDQAAIEYPLIAKPDVGERGFLVKKITGRAALRAHLEAWPVPFILQEFLPHPQEAAVLFYSFPGPDSRFGITSVCLKQFLLVCGDGVSNIRELMLQDARAAFQLPRFEREAADMLQQVPEKGVEVLLEPIGNHARGTKFLNGHHLINEQMLASFEAICRNIDGVCYGRFDLKFQDVAALQRGEFKTMELNGVFGEPAHVYDPKFGMWRAYYDFWRHWRLLFDLHRAQKKKGIYPPPLAEGWRFIQGYFRYKKKLEQSNKA